MRSVGIAESCGVEQRFTYRLPTVIYWINLPLLGVLLYVSLAYASRTSLLSPGATPEVFEASRRRIVVYQILHAAAALLCTFNTYVVIAGLVLLQINSVVAPRVGPLSCF